MSEAEKQSRLQRTLIGMRGLLCVQSRAMIDLLMVGV